MNVEDIKFREIQIFLNLLKVKSVRELGRQYNLQPGQISKIVTALELKLGQSLFERSANGLTPTARAMELVPSFEKIVEVQDLLSDRRESNSNEDSYSFGSSSFFSTHLLPLIIREMEKGQQKKFKVRIVDLPPSLFIPSALRGAFDYCLHSNILDWPKTWTTAKVGTMQWQIYARKGHPVLKNPNLREVKKHPFVMPIYWTNEGTRYGDDQCPIPMSDRKKGHETATASSALEIIKITDQLAFLPDIVALDAERKGDVAPVLLSSQPVVKRSVYLSVKNGVVKQRSFELISKAAKFALS